MQQYVLYQLIRWTRYQASFIKGLEGIFLKGSFLCIFSFDCGAGYHRMIPPTIVRIPSAENLYLRMLPPLSRHVPAVGNLWMISPPPPSLYEMALNWKIHQSCQFSISKCDTSILQKLKKYLRVFIFLLHFALMMFAEGEAMKYGCLWFECVTIFHYSSNQHQTSKKIEISQSPKRKSKFV